MKVIVGLLKSLLGLFGVKAHVNKLCDQHVIHLDILPAKKSLPDA